MILKYFISSICNSNGIRCNKNERIISLKREQLKLYAPPGFPNSDSYCRIYSQVI